MKTVPGEETEWNVWEHVPLRVTVWASVGLWCLGGLSSGWWNRDRARIGIKGTGQVVWYIKEYF